MSRRLLALSSLACMLTSMSAIVAAQAAIDATVDARAAEQAMARGDPAAAEAAYDRMLMRQPTDADALVGRGNARAFQKKYSTAQADFNAALALQPDHLGARVGLGHALAWSGRYPEAMAQFEHALRVAPGNADAARGAAYTELWRGNNAAAVSRFEQLLAQAPQDRGAQEGLAQARAAPAGRPPQYEFSLWLGRTSLPGGAHENGIRFGEIAVWPNERLRLFARYDDGLSRDNAALVRENRSAALKSAGGYWRWDPRFGSLLEIGRREFPDGVDQTLYRAEQTFYLDRGYEAKVGGWVGPRSDDRTEWLTYVGASIPWNEHWRFEPTFFHSRNGTPDGSESRLLLATNYDSRNGWEVGAGFAGGRAHVNDQDRTVREGFLRASWQVQPWVRLMVLARRETVSGGDAITVLSVGTTLTWK